MFMLAVDNMTCGKCVGRVEAKFLKSHCRSLVGI